MNHCPKYQITIRNYINTDHSTNCQYLVDTEDKMISNKITTISISISISIIILSALFFPSTYFKRPVVSRKYLGLWGHNVEPATPVLHLFHQQGPEISLELTLEREKVEIFFWNQERDPKYSMQKYLWSWWDLAHCCTIFLCIWDGKYSIA